MLIAVIVVIVSLIAFWLIAKTNLKAAGVSIIAAAIAASTAICLIKPKMHSPVSFEMIEYIFNINKDGSITTTKKITKTIIKKQQRGNQEE